MSSRDPARGAAPHGAAPHGAAPHGAAPHGHGEHAARAGVERSPQWRDGRFRNRLPRVDGPWVRAVGAFLFGGSKHRRPEGAIPVVRRTASDYDAPPASGLRVTWLGHSLLLLEIAGLRVLIDPMWGGRASPVDFAGPRRFFEPPLALDDLPRLDVVVLSHDHFDHLHAGTVRALAPRAGEWGTRWVAPLGAGAHLRGWGVRGDHVTELDWWQSTRVGALLLTATPARHFSGRGVGRADSTLWAGWAFVGPEHRVYYSGDSALQDEFVEIGRRLGPFDLTIIEAGAYDALWADVHLGPEQAVLAHRLVQGAAGGGVLLPVHWGTFDLALHPWTEPVERVLAAARLADVRVVTPRPGAMVEPSAPGPPERWWPDVPWRTAEEAPVRSTGVAHLWDAAADRVSARGA